MELTVPVAICDSSLPYTMWQITRVWSVIFCKITVRIRILGTSLHKFRMWINRTVLQMTNERKNANEKKNANERKKENEAVTGAILVTSRS